MLIFAWTPHGSHRVGSTFHYSSELPFYKEMRVKVLVEFMTCERCSHGKTVLVMFDLKQGLHVRRRKPYVPSVINQQYKLLTFPVSLSINIFKIRKRSLLETCFFFLFFFISREGQIHVYHVLIRLLVYLGFFSFWLVGRVGFFVCSFLSLLEFLVSILFPVRAEKQSCIF